MDPLVLIDAIAICMAYEEKELCKIGEVALAVIFDVASIILGSKERVRTSLEICLPVNFFSLTDRFHMKGILLKSGSMFRRASCRCSLTLWSVYAHAAMSRPGMLSWVEWCPLSS